jgi:ribosomal protein L12E/L44/L45/RPP1/RPP2
VKIGFNLHDNTLSDWVKAVGAGVAAGVAAFNLAASNGVTLQEWITVGAAVLVAGAAALGLWHTSASQEGPQS